MGAVVLTWWVGAYAIAFGIMMLFLGFKLRGKKTTSGEGIAPPAQRRPGQALKRAPLPAGKTLLIVKERYAQHRPSLLEPALAAPRTGKGRLAPL